MRQLASMTHTVRSVSSQLNTSRKGLVQTDLMPASGSFFREIADTHAAAICETLAHITKTDLRQQGWVLVIAPHFPLSKQFLEQQGIDCKRLLLINQKQVHHYDNLMRDALTCSTCSAVVSFLPSDSDVLDDYQYLANKYRTLLINHGATVQISH